MMRVSPNFVRNWPIDRPMTSHFVYAAKRLVALARAIRGFAQGVGVPLAGSAMVKSASNRDCAVHSGT
jgi:hypothetical protein